MFSCMAYSTCPTTEPRLMVKLAKRHTRLLFRWRTVREVASFWLQVLSDHEGKILEAYRGFCSLLASQTWKGLIEEIGTRCAIEKYKDDLAPVSEEQKRMRPRGVNTSGFSGKELEILSRLHRKRKQPRQSRLLARRIHISSRANATQWRNPKITTVNKANTICTVS